MIRSGASPPTFRVAWGLLDLTRTRLAGLEESSERIVGAQVAGLIALWSTIHTFDSGVPRALAWAAWVALLVSIGWLGRLVTPTQLARFWERLPVHEVAGIPEPDHAREVEIIRSVSEPVQNQIARLRSGLQVSIALGLLAMGLAALGYAIDKT
jgi:hypothetical protein